jgi:hypothetical protein
MVARIKLERRSKYGSVTAYSGDGKRFQSKKEARRYGQLQMRQRAGEISGLECQPAYRCEVNGRHVCTYHADFRYFDRRAGGTVVEDVKSPATRKKEAYRVKKKLVEALYGIEIVEV